VIVRHLTEHVSEAANANHADILTAWHQVRQTDNGQSCTTSGHGRDWSYLLFCAISVPVFCIRRTGQNFAN
jgi:hypothetical protein